MSRIEVEIKDNGVFYSIKDVKAKLEYNDNVFVDPVIQCWFGSVRFSRPFQPIILAAL